MKKGAFPYEYLTSIETLCESDFPDRDAFYSSLKGCYTVSEEEYSELKKLYYDSGWTCLWDLLEYYNNNDADITLAGIEYLAKFWKSVGLDLSTEAVSLPGLASKLLHKLTPFKKPIIYLPSKKDYSLYTWSSRALIGGPSIVYKRLACAGVSQIRGGPQICKRIVGLDANRFAIIFFTLCLNICTLRTFPVCTSLA